MTTHTPIIDSQVHSYERNSPERPWIGSLDGPAEITGDQMVEAMDAVGVDGALLVSPYSLYGFDPTYALEVYAKHPTRYRLIKPFDPHAESVVDEFAEWARTPGVVGGRIMLNRGAYESDDPRIDRLFDAAARAGVPLNVMAAGKLPLFRSYAERHPDTRLVIDHVGMITYNKPPIPDEPFADLPDVLSLAEPRPCRHQDLRRLHPLPSTLPVLGYLGALAPPVRRLWHRPVHVGHGLDPHQRPPHIPAGRRGLPPNWRADGCGALRPDGRLPVEALQLVPRRAGVARPP